MTTDDVETPRGVTSGTAALDIRRRSSCEAIVVEALEKARRLQIETRSVSVQLWETEAIADAQQEDRLAFASTEIDSDSPLHGLPVVISSRLSAEISRQQAKAGASDRMATFGGDAISSLRAVGAIILGESVEPSTRAENQIEDRTQSGAASLTSAGCAVAAVAIDYGDNFRVSASQAGLAGFRSSRAPLLHNAIAWPTAIARDAIGVIAKTIECCAIVESALRNEVWRPLPNIGLQGISLGLAKAADPADDRSLERNLENALEILLQAGARISDFEFPVLGSTERQTPARRTSLADRELVGDARDDEEPLSTQQVQSLELYDKLAPHHGVISLLPLASPSDQAIDLSKHRSRLHHLEKQNDIAAFFNLCAASIPVRSGGRLVGSILIQGCPGDDRRILAISQAIERLLSEVGPRF